MTFSSATNPAPRSARRGFTIIELLIVMGIIVLIIGITLPILVRARKTAAKTRMAIDLQGISQALESYRQDFKDYPRIDYSTNNPLMVSPNNLPNVIDRLGAITLCWALLSPGPAAQDGNDGTGFRVRGTQGQVYGPYIQADKFSISGTTDYDSTINDFHGNPYLYFPGFKGANISVANGYVADSPASAPLNPPPMYNHADNTLLSASTQLKIGDMQKIMGDTNMNTYIDGAESAATTAPYLLWCAGPDELWGYDSNGNTDDITNFNQ